MTRSDIASDVIEVQPRPCWIAGRPEQGPSTRTVRHPYDGTEIAEIAVPGADQVARAVAAAAAVRLPWRDAPAEQRATALDRLAELAEQRAEEFAETITAENGAPLAAAEAETTAAVLAFRVAAEQARRFGGRRHAPTASDRLAVARRRPRGPVLSLVPVQRPLGVLAESVAAALAVGAPVVVKPATPTPLSALLLGELLAEADLPAGVFSVLPLAADRAADLVADPRLPVLAVTGSAATVAALRAAGELLVSVTGTELTVVLGADWSDPADLEVAAARIAGTLGDRRRGRAGGAVCRVTVPTALADRFLPALVAAVTALPVGDPHDPAVRVGPLADEDTAERAERWRAAAVAAGARVLAGGVRTGSVLAPAVLRPPADGFGPPPVGPAVLVTVDDDPPATTGTVAVCTRDLPTALRAFDAADAGTVVVGGPPAADDPAAVTERVAAAVRGYTAERVLVLGR